MRRGPVWGKSRAPAASARGTSVRLIVCFVPRLCRRPRARNQTSGALRGISSRAWSPPRAASKTRAAPAREPRDAQLVLDRLEMGPQVDLGKLLDAKPLSPLRQNIGRRTVVKTAVDLAAAADAPPLDVMHLGPTECHRQAAVTVFRHHLLARERLDSVRGNVGTFLDQQNIATRFRQQTGGRCPPPGPDPRTTISALKRSGGSERMLVINLIVAFRGPGEDRQALVELDEVATNADAESLPVRDDPSPLVEGKVVQETLEPEQKRP